ncbi:MAG: VCBS repeat-containing protein [Polyangiaceae bacterium]|nr:VCBS repeat-containing protein [Polyangiaceae bacterium]
MWRALRPFFVLSTAAGSIALACGSDDGGGDVAGDCGGGCPVGEVCKNGTCTSVGDSGAGGSGGSSTGGTGGLNPDGPACAADKQCGDVCCGAGLFCALGAECAIEQAPCTTNDQCWSDSYCLNGKCIPYGVPKEKTKDESCKVAISIDKIVPSVQCRWTAPPAGDAYPNHVHVMATPVVVDLDLDANPKTLSPSIVFPTFPTAGSYGSAGILRVVSGADCAQQDSLNDAGDAVMAPSSVAVADLDGDKRAEIIAPAHGGGMLAFKFDTAAKKFKRLWRSGTCTGGKGPPTTPDATGPAKWSGPSIHDLNDDGKPEIIYGAVVYDSEGCVVSSALGFPAYSVGYVPVIADVDEDGKMELVQGNAIHEWDSSTGAWKAETYFSASGKAAGQVAVADLGSFPLAAFGNQDRAEVVVVSSGSVRVQTLEGTVIFGPVAVPGGGIGGPPTIADFDGDGRREFASAGGAQYVVFDFDCLAGGSAAGCGGQSKTSGVLWQQPSQDQSSNVTGSSVFDFDANGSAEAVYADECFLRIYEGATGKVLFSAARSSGTTYENPVIVDVDGDYRTEIVSAVNDYAGSLGCPAADPLYPAAKFAQNRGIVVLRDEQDRWASSRPVWNQHAYAVTHVGDHGESPKTSAVPINWKNPKLNNFRQNVQGGLDALGEPDLTAGGDVGAVKCNGTLATIEAKVCNRGTLPMVSGTEVAFFEGSETGKELCTAPIPVALGVGECLVVSCQAELGNKTIDVFVKVDPKSQSKECWEQNNAALYKGVACGKVPR